MACESECKANGHVITYKHPNIHEPHGGNSGRRVLIFLFPRHLHTRRRAESQRLVLVNNRVVVVVVGIPGNIETVAHMGAYYKNIKTHMQV